MYDQVVKCQRAGLCLSEHFLIIIIIIIIRAEFEAPKDKRKRNKRNVTLEPSFTQSPNTNLSFTSTISCHSSHLDLQ